MRPSGRKVNQMRKVTIEAGFSKYAEGSALIRYGDTHVLCTATVEEKTPPFLKNTGKGWITAEYGMLPRSTESRMEREAFKGKQTGRTHEIQRLIGRSLRAVTNLSGFGERQIRIDCDVIQADGGTRTASITGAYVALYQTFMGMLERKVIQNIPVQDQVAAVSCGIYNNKHVLDLDYLEDSQAETDANFILTGKGGIVEIQATAEQEPFSEDDFTAMLELAHEGIDSLLLIQRKALGLI